MDKLRQDRLDLIHKFLFERLTRDWQTAKHLSEVLLNKLESLETHSMNEWYIEQEQRKIEADSQTHIGEDYGDSR